MLSSSSCLKDPHDNYPGVSQKALGFSMGGKWAHKLKKMDVIKCAQSAWPRTDT